VISVKILLLLLLSNNQLIKFAFCFFFLSRIKSEKNKFNIWLPWTVYFHKTTVIYEDSEKQINILYKPFFLPHSLKEKKIPFSFFVKLIIINFYEFTFQFTFLFLYCYLFRRKNCKTLAPFNTSSILKLFMRLIKFFFLFY